MTLFGYAIGFKVKSAASTGGDQPAASGRCLCDAPSDTVVTFSGFGPGLSPERRAHLQAYGLITGRCVRVVQHHPVTVVLVDHCELALEGDLARLVEID